MYVSDRLLIIHELLGVELVVILIRQLALVLLPDRCHAVESLCLNGGGRLFTLLSIVGMLNVHLYGETDIVGILLDQLLYAPCFAVL